MSLIETHLKKIKKIFGLIPYDKNNQTIGYGFTAITTEDCYYFQNDDFDDEIQETVDPPEEFIEKVEDSPATSNDEDDIDSFFG